MISHGTLLQYADDSALISTGSSLNIVHEYLSQDLCLTRVITLRNLVDST